MGRAQRHKGGSVRFDKRRGTWNYLVYHHGKRRSKLLGSKREYPTKAAAWKAVGTRVETQPKPVHALTVNTLVERYREDKPEEGLQLPPLTRDLPIGYTSPSFLIPQKVRFRYRLDGHDRDWQDAGTRREAFYTDLGPGKYRFRVIACNNSGVWNKQGATLDFALQPPTGRRTGSAHCA
jgi:hypothetical protein